MSGERLRVAIAGAGFIAAVHARSARLAGADVVGVSASTPERAAEAARRLNVPRAFRSSEELAEADGVDVVHICTPNRLHAPLAEAALAAGKHVVCEKPLAMDAASAAALVDAAESAGRVAAVPFVYRFHPMAREARERVASGAAGDVRLIHGTYLQDWLASAQDDNWRVDAAEGGASRAFADIGSHWCDLAEFVSGHRILRLCARTLTAIPERRRVRSQGAFAAAADAGDAERRAVTTEDAVVVQFETDGAALGSVVVSQVSPGRKNRLWLEVDGAEEAVAFDQEAPESLWCGRRDAVTTLLRDPLHLSPAAARLAHLPAGHPQGYADCFDAFVADVHTAIRTGEAAEGLPVFADGLRAARLTEAVLSSASSERWTDVPAADPAEALR